MNTDKLSYLIEVKKTKSVSKAAKKLNISQSAVSQSIAEFERMTGYSLFKRTKHGMIPTERCRVLLVKSQEILHKVHEFEAEFFNDLSPIEIRIGAYPGFMPNFVKSIGEFKQSNLNTNVFITENNNRSILNEINDGKIEAGLVIWPDGFPENNVEFVFEPLAQGRFILCVNKKFKYTDKEYITQRELKEVPIIFFQDEFLQKFIDEFESKYGELNLLFTTNQADAARNALIENLGVLIGPNFTFISDPHIINGTLDKLEVLEFQNKILKLGWVTSSKINIQPKTEKFIKLFNSQNDWSNL